MISPSTFGIILVAGLGFLALTSWVLRSLESRRHESDRRLIREHIRAKGLRLRRIRPMYRAFPLIGAEYELIVSRQGPETRWDYLSVRRGRIVDIAEGEWQKSRRRIQPPKPSRYRPLEAT